MSISQFISNLSQKQINIIRTLLVPIQYLFCILDLLYPKNDKLIIFGSNTGEYMSGSPSVLYKYVETYQNQYSSHYYLPFNKKMNFKERVGYVIQFLPTFLNAKFLISSHPTFDFFPFSWSKRKILINVWHGVPLKSLFYADAGESEKNLKDIRRMIDRTSFLIVASKLESALLTECMLIDPRKILVTGHPRNDILIRNEKSNLKKILGNMIKNNKIILYCPTYRRGAKTKFFPFDDLDWDHLNQFLKENNALILIRGHVYNKLDKFADIFTERIIDFSFDVCNNVNSILADVDILITDYSSIYIDYLILNRPCIFIPYDLEDYDKDRGLLLDDYDFWTPGEKVLTYSEFILSLKNLISGNDTYQKKRIDICNQFHYYKDGKSCERVFELIKKSDK